MTGHLFIAIVKEKSRDLREQEGKIMSAAIRPATPDLRSDLINWRERLQASSSPDTIHLDGLLREVSAAIERLDLESYGVCKVCNEMISQTTINADPLARTCF